MDPSKHHNALEPHARLHWYEIKSILGQGGFGITYLAYDTNLKQQVAIKEYLPVEFSTRDASNTVLPISQSHEEIYRWGLQRFLEEAQTLARFKHPNIIQVRTFFEHNNTGYIVMDYEKGVELETLIDKGAHFNEQRLLDILLPILDGLAQIHKTGIIHRDIKPANIYIRNDQSPVLLDFGSARYAISNHTKTMTSLVTPGYAPFEQYHQAEGKQGPWTDIYALGATCYCAITGKPPPDALKRGMVQFEHNLDVYLELADIKSGKYSQLVLEAIDCALRFREQERPQTVTAWRQMLTSDRPTSEPRAKAEQTKVTEALSRQRQVAKGVPESAKDRAASSIWLVLRRLVLLGLIALTGWYVYNHQQDIDRWFDAYVENLAAKQLEAQKKNQEARRNELARQQVLKKKLKEEARIRALEQEKLARQELEQRKIALQAELERLEQQTEKIAGQLQSDESDKPQQENEHLAELAKVEADQHKREKLARQEAARELEEERQGLEREKERLAALQKQVEEESHKLAEEQRQAELARQRAEQVHEAEMAGQRAALAQLEEEQRIQTELARQLVEQQEMADLSTEAAINQLRIGLSSRLGQTKPVVDEAVLAEIVHQQMEKLRLEETARLRTENLAVAQRLLQSADEYSSHDHLEEALTDYRNAYDLNASSITREAAIRGIVDTMERLYADGNSETWRFFKGNRLENLSGEYIGNYQAMDKTGKREKPLAVATMVAHKDNQLTIAAMDLGIVVIANIESGKGDLSFYDTKNDIHGTGTLVTDSNDFAMSIDWSSADGSFTGSWRARNQRTLWHIDLNGEYVAEVTNTHASVFRKKTFNFTLTDLTTPTHTGNPDEISGISEDGTIQLSGRKTGVNRIEFEFNSGNFKTQGNGEFEVSGVHGNFLTGTWETLGSDFQHQQSSGKWTLEKLP